jgi:hypothetical protein
MDNSRFETFKFTVTRAIAGDWRFSIGEAELRAQLSQQGLNGNVVLTVGLSTHWRITKTQSVKVVNGTPIRQIKTRGRGKTLEGAIAQLTLATPAYMAFKSKCDGL